MFVPCVCLTEPHLDAMQTQSVDNISMWAKNNGTAVPDGPVLDLSSSGSVIEVAQ
jgi:hypothetical protein